MQTVTLPELASWSPSATLGPAVSGGLRNTVRRAVVDGRPVVVRRSRRTGAALDWELDLLATLAGEGFLVPVVVPAASGARHVDGVVVATEVDGRAPSSDDDWHAVAAELRRLHDLTAGWGQRPGFLTARQLLTERRGGDVDLDAMPDGAVSLVRDAWAEVPDGGCGVVYGDVGSATIRISEGRVGLTGWDHTRLDHPWFDLADLPVRHLDRDEIVAACAAAHAWEAASSWTDEPAYARWRLELLDTYRLVH